MAKKTHSLEEPTFHLAAYRSYVKRATFVIDI